jgi:heat induced stress protein YflT
MPSIKVGGESRAAVDAESNGQGLASSGETVSTHNSYEDAEQAVDYLSDKGFPVENVQIVGSNLHLVEQVTGRVTTGSATLAGAGSGAWFGLFIGLLVGLFSSGPEWVGLVLGGLVIGAVWGAIFGFFAQYAMRGRRDFASARALVAERYDVMVTADAQRARTLIAQHP